MLSKIVQLITSTKYIIERETIFCREYVISDVECLNFLEERNILESPLIDNKFGSVIDIELSVTHLSSIGFYAKTNSFLKKNRYKEPESDYYILELNKYKDSNNIFLETYRTIIKLLNSIELCAKHNFVEIDLRNSIIFLDKESLLLPLIYDEQDIWSLQENTIKNITETGLILKESNSEKKLIFLIQVVEFLQEQKEENRFKFLLRNFQSYYNNSLHSYEYYLRDFSFNKLKLELDSKALEFTQKIQSVINDSQTKLVAIPTAFVLVVSAFEFSDLISVKNIISILSLFIFAVILQLFVNNQFSMLKFLEENINSYKATFTNSNIEILSERFKMVDRELIKQRTRFKIVACILWAIPILLFLGWVLLIFQSKKSLQRIGEDYLLTILNYGFYFMGF